MAENFAEIARRIIAVGAVTDADCLEIRSALWDDGTIGADEADRLFAIDDACTQRTDAWGDLFVEAVAHLLTHQTPPFGYIDDQNAAWLISRMEQKTDSAANLPLLVMVLETADNAPDALKTYAIARAEHAVDSRPIDDATANLVRRLVFARGGDGGMYVSKAEAEMLFRIKDLTLGQPNAPSWKTLFVQAVGNHFMAHPSGHRFDRGKALEAEHFLDDSHPHVGRFLLQMGLHRPSLREPRHELSGDSPAETVHAAAAFGNHDALERALLDFIAQETGDS
jgi:hypothetical protein